MKRRISSLLLMTASLATSATFAVGMKSCEEKLRGPKVVIHALATDFIPFDDRQSFTILTEGSSPKGFDNLNLIWSRDRFPIRVVRKNGAVKLLRYASLLGTLSSPFYDGGSTYVPFPAPQTAPPNAKPYTIDGRLEWLEVDTLPLVLEGGNLQLGDDFLLVGEKVFLENAKTFEDWYLKISKSLSLHAADFAKALSNAGYRPRSADEIRDLLAEKTGIEPSKILTMPWMPGEKTGHVDVYVGKLTSRTLVVPAIPQAFIDRLSMNHEKEFAVKTRDWLDARAADLGARGLSVKRMPMLPPRNLVASAQSPLGWDAQFPSPVNFIVDGKRVLIPHFPNFAESLNPGFDSWIRREITEILSQQGFEAVFVNAEKLLPHNGLLHCISGEI